MVDFSGRIGTTVGEVITELVDDALVAHNKAEYEKGRGSGQGDIAYKRIGAAYAGVACARALAYRFHKFPREERDGPVSKGELTRHGEAGHWTEKKTAEWLYLAGFGISVCDETGAQHGWKAAHDPLTGQYSMAGEVDGKIHAVPARLVGLIKLPCLWESKKATDKKWKKFQKDHVKSADPAYYGQLQLNMGYMGMEQTLFSMLNLDTMKYYFELVSFDLKHAQMLSDRALSVIQSASPDQFARLCRAEDDFNGKFCDFHDQCWRK